MPITPLPQFEADAAELERERAERIAATKPETVVVRFGAMRMIGEFRYAGDVRPGCGSKLVCSTHRGTELGELLTSTCPNAGCGSSVTRQEMLEYIEASGGRQYPFHTDGRALRVATVEDLQRQAELDARAPELLNRAKQIAKRLGLDMKPVQVELILGNERATVYFASEDRVDFREMVQELRGVVGTRVEMRQVGARDEARLTADYERCGQYCCCKSFLKVLKPVSMKSAKVQKATLDPLKISGRCGRLMCCLRYEDETYEDLAKRLPKRRARVGTPEGDGVVIETQILTQLVLVALDGEDRQIAVPVEELSEAGAPRARPEGRGEGGPARRSDARGGARSGPRPEPRAARAAPARDAPAPEVGEDAGEGGRKRRRRRRKGRAEGAEPGAPSGEGPARGEGTGEPPAPGEGPAEGEGGAPRKKRRRRRRRRGGGEGGGGGADPGAAGPGGGGGGGSA